MKKCQKCGVPLDGFFSKIANLIGVKQSEKDPSCCNKCAAAVSQVPPPQEPVTPPAQKVEVKDETQSNQ
jgi:hypothetical protein